MRTDRLTSRSLQLQTVGSKSRITHHASRFILLLYLALAGLFAITTPAWQNPDEPAHYNYVAFVAEERRLPVLQMGDYDEAYLQRLKDQKFPPDLPIDTVRYEYHQPPLYYILAAPVYWLSGGSLLALRLFTVLIGGGVLLLIFACARTLLPEQPLIALGALAFAAFLPMHVALMASVNNDALAELLIAAGMLVLLRWLNRGRRQVAGGRGQTASGRWQVAGGRPQAADATRTTHHAPRNTQHATRSLAPSEAEGTQHASRPSLLTSLGIIIGLGFLTKATAYILLPVALLAVTVSFWHGLVDDRQQTSDTVRPQAGYSLLLSDYAYILLPALLLGLPLWVRNSLVYGNLDFLGLAWHDLVVTGQPTTADWIAANGWAAYWERAWTFTFKSFWGVFGWLGVFMDARVYTGLGLFTLIAAGGGLYGLGRVAARRSSTFRPLGDPAWQVVFLLGAGAAAAYAWYNLGFIQHQGRYLFPGLLAWSLLCAAGWWLALEPGTSPLVGGGLLILLGGRMIAGVLIDAPLQPWTVLLWSAAGAGLLLYGLLSSQLPRLHHLRQVVYGLPFLLLILLDAGIPFLYIIPQLR